MEPGQVFPPRDFRGHATVDAQALDIRAYVPGPTFTAARSSGVARTADTSGYTPCRPTASRSKVAEDGQSSASESTRCLVRCVEAPTS